MLAVSFLFYFLFPLKLSWFLPNLSIVFTYITTLLQVFSSSVRTMFVIHCHIKDYIALFSLFLQIFSDVLILYLVSERYFSLYPCAFRFQCHIFHHLLLYYPDNFHTCLIFMSLTCNMHLRGFFCLFFFFADNHLNKQNLVIVYCIYPNMKVYFFITVIVLLCLHINSSVYLI